MTNYIQAGLCVLCSFLFITAALANSETIGVPDSGVELGLGWDTQRARTLPNRCIEFAPIQETGQTVKLKVSDVSDSSDVAESLNVSASMSIRSTFGSASAQSEFASSSKVSAIGNSLLIRATVDNGVMFAGPPKPTELTRKAFPLAGEKEKTYISRWMRWADEDLPTEVVLSEEAQDVLGKGSAKELKAFEALCGDSYISAIYSGAEMLALMSFTSKSRSDAQNTSASVKGAVSAWGVSGDVAGSIGGASQVKQTNTSIDIDYTQIGGAGGIIPTSKDEFFQKLHALPQEALAGPQFHTMDVTPYNELPSWPKTIGLDTQEDPLDVVLTNYYATLNSIDAMIEDLRQENQITEDEMLDRYARVASRAGGGRRGGATFEQLRERLEAVLLERNAPQKARLNKVQDKVLAFRRRLYDVLRDAYVMNETPVYAPSRWSFGNRAKKAQDAVEEDLAQRMQALENDLVAFSFGRKNPNLIKLYLPIPGEKAPTEKEDRTKRGAASMEYYLQKQAKRICANSPLSPECLSNVELSELITCIPHVGQWLSIPESCKFVTAQASKEM